MRGEKGDRGLSEQETEWCGVRVVIDDATVGLLEMSVPDAEPDQRPIFRVTSSTASLVAHDFELYMPSLVRMAHDWKEKKGRRMRELEAERRGGSA